MAPKAKKEDTTFFDNLITKEPKITVLIDNPVSLADMKSDIFNFRYHVLNIPPEKVKIIAIV